MVRLPKALTLACLMLGSVHLWAEGVCIDPEEAFPETIGDFRLFADNLEQKPNEGLIPYELNTPHFADYANLHRFLWVPPNDKVSYQEDGSLLYPVGSALVLTVGYLEDMRNPQQGERLIETRLLVKSKTGWRAAQYVWNEEATDASLSPVGGERLVEWIHSDGSKRSLHYHVPNINQCKMCHELADVFVPLGPLDSRNLNRSIVREGEAVNQLEDWKDRGILEGLPEQVDDLEAFPKWNDPSTGSLDERARAYLHVNCSSCHQPGGLAYTSGLDLTFDQRIPIRFGVFKSPVAAGRGVGAARFGIYPGEPEASILYHRLGSTDPGVRMPVVGRSLVHEEGLALIREWIEEMRYPELMKQHEHKRTALLGLWRTDGSEAASR
ncbi:MAG: hypothetical protein H6752_12245 [Candidatus Omnitrophica bacterium]|nr:hypothetical protein [Candidatus Omnitrophota bacterium]